MLFLQGVLRVWGGQPKEAPGWVREKTVYWWHVLGALGLVLVVLGPVLGVHWRSTEVSTGSALGALGATHRAHWSCTRSLGAYSGSLRACTGSVLGVYWEPWGL